VRADIVTVVKELWERKRRILQDEAKELIFMSREILQELEITINQFYILHLVDNGRYGYNTSTIIFISL
jgi:hypothetical protein